MSHCLPDDYVARLDAVQNPEQEAQRTDDWQAEVYLEAAAIAAEHGCQRILDVGCGSGFKLLKHFSDLSTIGIDLVPTVHKLRAKYPERTWVTSSPSSIAECVAWVDLVICSDVIEHVDDPDAFLNCLKSKNNPWIVISTPDRAILPDYAPQSGPPLNTCHVREWSFDEFEQYLASHFTVAKHFISNRAQWTQCAVVRAYPDGSQ